MSVKLRNQENFYSKMLYGVYKELYLKVIDNLSKDIFKTKASNNFDENYQAQLDILAKAVIMGVPELFYVGGNFSCNSEGGDIVLQFENCYPDKNHNEQNQKLLDVIDEIVIEAKKIEDDMERIMFVNKWICENVCVEQNLSPTNGNAYSSLVDKRGRCEAISEGAKLIFDALGMNCMLCGGTVDGEDGEPINHEWNAIEYKGEFYAFDFTWNCSLTVNKTPCVIYTFLNQQTISIEHKPMFQYPISENDSYHFWNLHNGNAEYVYELQNADLIECGQNYISVHHLIDMKFDSYEEEYALRETLEGELAPYNVCDQMYFIYRRDIDVLIVYYLNN